jgi:hypothetical protein
LLVGGDLEGEGSVVFEHIAAVEAHAERISPGKI